MINDTAQPCSLRLLSILLWAFFLSIYFCADRANCDTGSLTGLWQGPHPELRHVSFLFHLKEDKQGELSGDGYWMDQNIVNARFPIDSVRIRSDSVFVVIGSWNCVYTGALDSAGRNLIGKFTCAGEKPDPVNLNRISADKVYGLFADHLTADGKFKFHYFTPVKQNDGLEVADVLDTGIDSLELAAMVGEIGSGKYGKIHAFLLMIDGKLSVENYFFGFNAGVLHPMESSTKSVMSLLVGILKDLGYISDLMVPVTDYFSSREYCCAADLQQVSLINLLTMSCSISYDQNELLFSENRLRYMLNCGSTGLPAGHFYYQNWNVEMLGAVIREMSGMFADDFARAYLFDPLGIREYQWDTFRNHGYPLCSGSLWLKPRDMIKIGELVLKKGRWHTHTLISSAWIESSVRAYMNTGLDQDQYGYLWWISQINSGGQFFPMIWANGMGSQFIFIFPEQNMVMVTTGGNWEGGDNGRSWDIIKMLEKHMSRLIKGGT